MKYCSNCGKPLDDNAVFCGECGAPQTPAAAPVPAIDQSAENAALDGMKKFLGYEHASWKAGWIVLLCAMVIFILAGVMFLLGGGAGTAIVNGILNMSYDYYPKYAPYVAAVPFVTAGIVYIVIALIVYLPLMIINLKAMKRNEFYQNVMATDVSVARTRCTSVGMIVFAAIFNDIALIFIIINFVKTKNNRAVFDQIEAKQHGKY